MSIATILTIVGIFFLIIGIFGVNSQGKNPVFFYCEPIFYFLLAIANAINFWITPGFIRVAFFIVFIWCTVWTFIMFRRNQSKLSQFQAEKMIP